MSSRKLTVIAVALLMATGMLSPDAMAQTQRESFEEFRARVKGNYQQFRKTLLDNYADFLAGEWHEYQSLNGTSRDATPEPRKLPVYKPEKPQTPAQPTEPERETPGPATPRAEVPKATSKPKSDRATDRFLLGTMPVQISHADYQISHKLYSNNDYAAHWRELDRQEVASNVVPALQALAAEAGLNGYLTYKLAESYVNTRHADADATSRISLLHYLLAHLGYDSRLATTATGVPMLLLPLDRTVHARTFLKMDGRKYYIFTPEGIDQHAIAGQPISTCRIPEDLNQNKPIDMLIGQLNLPSKPKPFEIAYGGISISGNVNENLIPLLYNYPQMEVSEYGRCNPDPKLRASVTQQIHDQLATLPADQGAEKLLGFMQRAFDYATDEDFHGFEKPYFIEETLYYPKNDCEDRAIFYTYFLWNAIGKPAQIVTFPGHAAATITLDSPIDGVSYDSQGRKWWISDPTYVGAPTGLVMPMYRDTKPKVEITYQ